MQQDYLVVESRDDGPYIVTAPLPQHINIDRELFAQAEDFTKVDPDIDRPALWRQEIPHADPDRDNDGWALVIDATNVRCSYRIASTEGDGPLSATLLGWAEK